MAASVLISFRNSVTGIVSFFIETTYNIPNILTFVVVWILHVSYAVFELNFHELWFSCQHLHVWWCFNQTAIAQKCNCWDTAWQKFPLQIIFKRARKCSSGKQQPHWTQKPHWMEMIYFWYWAGKKFTGHFLFLFKCLYTTFLCFYTKFKVVHTG